jgi:ATP/maltotriose-dependent transcriptional regulator MalT
VDGYRSEGGPFVGRQDELSVLRATLDEVRAGEPRVVLVTGAPGIGKSALLERFLAGAEQVRVLRGGGTQEERLVPYGVAEQLARSARMPLPEPLAALDVLSSGRSPEPFVIGAGFVELLGSLPGEQPVVLVVDDAHWADRPTLLALLFALRRLQADRVLAVIVSREDDIFELPEGLVRIAQSERGVTLRLGGLDVGCLQELTAAVTGGALSAQAAEHLHDHTGGNPLHVVALLDELPLEKLLRGGQAPLPSPRSFSVQVLSRLTACAPDTQRLILAASTLGLQSPLVLAAGVAEIDDPLPALEEAMSARLLEMGEVDGEPGLAFTHTLVQAAVYHDIGPVRRAALHRRAAELVADEAASLQHRSAAALGEDEELATDLGDYARREGARGAWASAAAAMVRASRLSPKGEQRDRRLLEGVDHLLTGGDLTQAVAFTEAVAGCADGPNRRYVLGRLAFLAGRSAEGQELQLGAWDACDPVRDRELASRIATEVALVLVRQARGEELVTWARRAMAAAEDVRLSRAPWPHLAYGLAYAGRAREGLAELPPLPRASRDLSSEDVLVLYARGVLRFVTDDLAGARADFAASEPGAARWGPFMYRVSSLTFLSAVEYRLGAWDDAIAHGELGASIGEDADQAWMLSWLHAVAAAPLAARGEWAPAEAHAAAAARYARIVDDVTGIGDAGIAHAQIAAARGDHRAVGDALLPLLRMRSRDGIDEPGTRWPWQAYYADAMVGLGRIDEAESVLGPFEERATARRLPSAMAAAARVRGSLEAARKRPDAAEAAFVAGLEHAEAVPTLFDRALLEAAYGRFLRRAGKRRAAVTQLMAARDRFAELRAHPYTVGCEQELAVCGITATKRLHRDHAALTPQEISIARLVAGGLSNREVAAQAVVSLNTVEYHLKNIYSKLGIASRSQLPPQLAEA